MKIIRNNIFETNSSSTHALVIPHEVDKDNYNVYDSLDHDYGFGRGESRLVDHYDEKLAYTYYVLKNFEERYDIRDEDEGYGSDIKVTEDELNSFKDKVREAFNQVLSETDSHLYDSNPTPDDLFYLIDHIDDLGKIKYNPYTDEEPEGVDKETIRLAHILHEYVGNNYCRWVGVDHTEDFGTNGFIEKMLSADVSYIKKFIFNSDSYITVCGDEDRGYNIKTIGFEYDYSHKKYPEYQVNEKGERCPDRSEFPDTDEGWDEWWKVQEQYPITKDNGGFWDRLHEYEKDNDVYLKGN